MTEGDPFERWIRRWNLIAEGAPITTHSSRLLPVLYRGVPAMLKVATIPEEARGSRQLAWWGGAGVAKVLELEGDTVLLVRASGPRSLVNMSRGDSDDEATSVIVKVAAVLHRPSAAPLPDLLPLNEWFASLFLAAPSAWSELAIAARTARRLLATSTEAIPLHGDLHHWNVLDFAGEWRAIDPKGPAGERTFDLVHLLRNPDCATALAPGRLTRRVEQVSREAAVDRVRLVEWALAFAGLSAAWTIEDGENPEGDLRLLRMFAGLLGAG